MANADVRAAAATLDTAIQAVDPTDLEAATFTKDKHTSYVYGLRFNLARSIERVKDLSTELVAQLENIRELE